MDKLLIDLNIKLSDEKVQFLKDKFEIYEYDSQRPNFKYLNNCSALLVHTVLKDDHLDTLLNCRYIGVRAHNLDYVNVKKAESRGIKVSGIPAVGQISVAEHTFALIFAVAKNVITLHRNTVSGNWREGFLPGLELNGKKLGIVGYGEIGRRVAEIGKLLGMSVVIASKPNEENENRFPLESVLRESDILTLHLSANVNNKLFMNKERLNMMKKGAVFINTARGMLVDYNALEIALREKRIGGAGLDVYPEEPVISSTLFNLDNVVCTPHTAFCTDETINKMNDHLIERLQANILAQTRGNV